jgi:hypothetical protein
MAYLNPDWLLQDEHAEYIDDVADISAYDVAIDREVETIALTKGVRVDEIPVDGSGYLDSRVLQSYAIAYAMYVLFRGYWGKRSGNQDIYYDKMIVYEREVQRLSSFVTYGSIIGLEDTNGDPKCTNGSASQVAI